MNYRELCLERPATVRDAMRRLDSSAVKVIFITDCGRLVASLTDGDVRRFLLSGGHMQEAAEKAANPKPRFAPDMEQAARLYDRFHCLAIPIVAGNREITDVYIGEPEREAVSARLGLPVVINAGGRGTRLDPYTRVLPKPLIPVGDTPIIEHIMRRFTKFGCERFHVIVNYKKQIIKAYFSENEESYDVRWYDEEKPLGTGGGLSLLRGRLDGTFFFTNCDILLQSDYESMLSFHRQQGNLVTLVCAYKHFTIPYGVLDIGVNGAITNMREKPEMSFLTNTGMYIVEPEVLDYVQDDVAVGFPDVVEKLRSAGGKVAVYPVSESEWLDMGQLNELEKMRVKLYGE